MCKEMSCSNCVYEGSGSPLCCECDKYYSEWKPAFSGSPMGNMCGYVSKGCSCLLEVGHDGDHEYVQPVTIQVPKKELQTVLGILCQARFPKVMLMNRMEQMQAQAIVDMRNSIDEVIEWIEAKGIK